MSRCDFDVKAYALGEMNGVEYRQAMEHVEACAACREEAERLGTLQTALFSLKDEEVPQRIAFVSDKVFEPRWWQRMWHSGPVMGFASAALLTCAILVHAFAHPTTVTTPVSPVANTAEIEQRINQEVSRRVSAQVATLVSASEQRQAKETARLVEAVNHMQADRRQDEVALQEVSRYYQQKWGRMLVASRDTETGVDAATQPDARP